MRAAARVVEHLNVLGEASGNGRRFCGAHRRSEPDIQHMGSAADGTRLTNTYLDAVLAAGTKQCGLVYVAHGTKEHLDRFSALASAHNITLITLRSLIKSTTLLQVTAGWSYSQKSVLENEILAASHKFVGASVSSFSWNLAIRRYFAQSTDTLPLHNILRPLQSITYHDDLSTIYRDESKSRTTQPRAQSPTGYVAVTTRSFVRYEDHGRSRQIKSALTGQFIYVFAQWFFFPFFVVVLRLFPFFLFARL